MSYQSKYKGKQIDEAVLQATDKLPVRLSEVERGILHLEKNKADSGSVPNKMSQLTDDIGVGVTKQTVEDTKAEVKQLSTATQRALNDIEAIAKGRATGYVFDTLDDLNLWLEDVDNTEQLNLGDNLYIRATDVPDYWWDGEQKQELETQKVNLVEYVKNTDYATQNVGGVVKPAYAYAIAVNINGQMYIVTATKTEIDAGIDPYHPITPSNLEYAVKSVGDGYYATEEQVGDINTALDSVIASQESILAMQNALIGGDA